MPSLRPAVRRLAVALGAAAVVAVPLVPGTAQAQEPAGSTVVGELVQAWPESEHADAAGAAAEQPLTWVETADGESVRIPTEDAAGLEPGSTVEVTVGAEVTAPATEDGLQAAREVLDTEVVAEAQPVRAATNQVTVALVAPRGVAHDAVAAAEVAAVVDGPVAQFWSGQTEGAVDLNVTETHGWVDTTVGCGKPAALWDEAAAKVGFTPGPGKHLLLYLSSASPANCAYGLAEVGSQRASGGRAWVREALPSLVAHELGHNLGLGHSSALYCAAGPESGGCTTAAYRDHYDVMGASWEQVGTLNVVQEATLGLLGTGDLRALKADGSSAEVMLTPLSGTEGVRAVRLTGRNGLQYWLELRTGTGQDAWLGTGADRFGLQSGVLIRRLGDWPDTSLLLDATPAAGRHGDYQAALPVGKTVRLVGGFAVTVTAEGADGATLAISSTASGAAPQAPAAPGAGQAPDVLAAEGGTAAPAAEPATGTTQDAPEAVTAQNPLKAASAAADAEPETVTAEPAVVPASQSRPLTLPLAAGGVLAAAALLVGLRLFRTRARR
jgi:hypothetical protein